MSKLWRGHQISNRANDLSILEEAQKFLRARGISKGIVLFTMITGSSAYNLSDENSDMDFLGVYMTPAENYSFQLMLKKK